MNIRRKAQLVEGKPNEHDGEVIAQPMKDFDIEKTVFHPLVALLQQRGPLGTNGVDEIQSLKENFAKELFWSDKAVTRVEAGIGQMTGKLLHVKELNPELLKFMYEECDFKLEHADGSFMDHLLFCYVYGSVHMSNHSPIPLFLHSIMGVGQNLFPMKLEQKHRLAELVSSEDLVHIEAFPTIIRLLNTRALLDDLMAMSNEDLENIDGFECCRLLGPGMDHDGQTGKSDNATLHLNCAQFWVHLNYQLIHTMDFLPPVQWKEMLHNSLLHVFVDLHYLLKRAGKLMSTMDFDSARWLEKQGTEGLSSVDQLKAMMTNFSEKINHSLDYKILSKIRAKL